VVDAVDKLDKALKDIGGCTDGYCVITGHAKGMHTNGGCRCSKDEFAVKRALMAFQMFRKEVIDGRK